MLMLKQIRQARKLSVPALAELSGIPRRTIQEMERRGDCRLSTAYEVAQALNINIDDLWKPSNKE